MTKRSRLELFVVSSSRPGELSVISVSPVGLINITSSLAIVHQYLHVFPEARLFAFCNRVRGGSWVKKCENASATKVIRSTFNSGAIT